MWAWVHFAGSFINDCGASKWAVGTSHSVPNLKAESVGCLGGCVGGERGDGWERLKRVQRVEVGDGPRLQRRTRDTGERKVARYSLCDRNRMQQTARERLLSMRDGGKQQGGRQRQEGGREKELIMDGYGRK